MRGVLTALRPGALFAAAARSLALRRHRSYQRLGLGAVFNRIYERGHWGSGDGPFFSGAGSHDHEVVDPYIRAVRALLESLQAQPVVVDLGSGDFNVGRQIADAAAMYHGCDIVPGLIDYNRSRFESTRIRFSCRNIVEDDLPDGDVVLIRQVLQHLSNAQIRRIVEKCQQYRYWVITEHLSSSPGFTPNIDISAGSGTRVLLGSGVVLTEPPFVVPGRTARTLCELFAHGGIIRTVLFEPAGA